MVWKKMNLEHFLILFMRIWSLVPWKDIAATKMFELFISAWFSGFATRTIAKPSNGDSAHLGKTKKIYFSNCWLSLVSGVRSERFRFSYDLNSKNSFYAVPENRFPIFFAEDQLFLRLPAMTSRCGRKMQKSVDDQNSNDKANDAELCFVQFFWIWGSSNLKLDKIESILGSICIRWHRTVGEKEILSPCGELGVLSNDVTGGCVHIFWRDTASIAIDKTGARAVTYCYVATKTNTNYLRGEFAIPVS